MAVQNALGFVETAELPRPRRRIALTEAAAETPPLNLDQLPPGMVSGNTLFDFSAAASVNVKAGVSLAMLFAGQTADAAMKEGDDEDDRFAAYKTNLGKLGFTIAQSAVTASKFKKQGLFVHKAIIPFLTIALGGAGVGPVILAALNNLQEIDKDKPWITLFDRESRKFETRELHFAAVSTDAVNTSVRHVIARFKVEQTETNILFLKVTDMTAEFESATTTMSANNSLLAVLEPHLRKRMEDSILQFIAGT
jgi:hypothetical protein